MLAKVRTLRHPSGVEIKTPLLVPSFSSKGFAFDKNGNSEMKKLIKYASQYIDRTFLISAYDVHHHNVPEPISLSSVADVAFLDSGGYETSSDYDLSNVRQKNVELKEWNLKLYNSVLSSWPNYMPAVFVSYDHGARGRNLKSQIKSASSLFIKYPLQLSDFLIKPDSTKDRFLNLKNVLTYFDDIINFDIIGFTEKELGKSPFERMLFIARVRQLLEEKELDIPIHIFGSLDPISSWLYFLSGADIFDGLTWIRYAYYKGMCLYYQNYGSLELDINKQEDFMRGRIIVDNLIYMDKLQGQMRSFTLDQDFDKIKYNKDFLAESYYRLIGEIGGN